MSAQHAKTRINQLKKWAPRYIKVYNAIYNRDATSSVNSVCITDKQSRDEFEMVSAEVDDLLGCDECGSGGIEDAEVSPDCQTCVEFVKLWKATPEVHCYTWSI